METRLQPLHLWPEPGSASRGGDFPTGRRPGSRRPQGWLPRGLSRWPASPRAPGHPSVRLCPSRPFSKGHGSRGTSAHPSDLPTTFLKGLRPNPVTLGGRSGLHHRNSERGHSPPLKHGSESQSPLGCTHLLDECVSHSQTWARGTWARSCVDRQTWQCVYEQRSKYLETPRGEVWSGSYGARGAGKAPRERRGREGRAGLGTRGWTSVQRRREGAAEPLSGPDGDAAFSGACLRCRCVAKVALGVLRKRQSSSPPWRTGDAPTPCVHDRGPALRAWGSASC